MSLLKKYKKYTLDSQFFPLEREEIEYLEEDSILPPPQSLEDKIKQSLKKYGHVFPKLDSKAPKEASWINCNSLKCSSVSDVVCLLKSSNYQNPTELCLRKWFDLDTRLEFRCWVSNKILVAMCPRHSVNVDPNSFSRAREFLNNIMEDTYCVDLYLFKSVYIIDFNEYEADGLIYDNSELEELRLNPKLGSLRLNETRYFPTFVQVPLEVLEGKTIQELTLEMQKITL